MAVFNSHCIPLYNCLNDPSWLWECMHLFGKSFFWSTASVIHSPLCYECSSEQGGNLVHFHFTCRGQECSLYAEVIGSTFLLSCRLIYQNNTSVTDYSMCLSHRCAVMITSTFLRKLNILTFSSLTHSINTILLLHIFVLFA